MLQAADSQRLFLSLDQQNLLRTLTLSIWKVQDPKIQVNFFTVVNGKPAIRSNLSQRSQNPSVFRGPQRLTRGSLDFIALIEL